MMDKSKKTTLKSPHSGGRPTKINFKSMGFDIKRSEGKYSVLCTVCHKILHNTAEQRLKAHRFVLHRLL